MQNGSSKKLSPIEGKIPPYQFNVTDSIISTEDGKLLSTIVIEGMPYESESDNLIRNRFIAINNYLRSIGKDCGGNLAIWTHIVKRRVSLLQRYEFKSQFVTDFVRKYCESFENGNFFKTQYYVTFVLKYSDFNDGVEQLTNINNQALTVFKNFNCSLLTVQDSANGLYLCENSQFLSFLLNGQETQIPLSHTPVVESIQSSEWAFGYDVEEIRNKETLDSRFAVSYLLKDYPAKTKNGMWDFLLAAPYEFILSQSFIFTSSQKSLKMIDQQQNKLASVSDAATHQVEELELGKAVLSSGEAQFGDYQASLIVYGNSPEQALNNGNKVASEFLTLGRGARWLKCNLEAPFAFISIMPSSKYRPLSSVRTSANLACGVSFHNYSFGKPTGNPIGDGTAIMPVKTRSDGLYFLNTHYSDLHKNVTGQFIAGHALILGATGTGKTTLEATMCAFVQRFDPQMFVIDFNRSTELFVRAYGGSYFTLQEGVFTGLNPFQITYLDESGNVVAEPTPELRQFLYRLVERCASDENGKISDKDAKIVKNAVDAVLGLDVEQRRFSALLLDIPGTSDLHTRLSKWCTSEGGKLAWALDSPVNKFNPNDFDKIGFDTTVILQKDDSGKTHAATEPLLATLFFYKNMMQKEGRLMLTIVEEFWMPANFPLTQSLIKAGLKAGRLKGEFLWLISQSPEDAINCEIFSAIVQQTPTKILLPNPDAVEESYLKIGCTKKEFDEISKLDKECRMFLVKQSNSSCFAKMDLSGFDDFLPIISGSSSSIALCERIRKELNTEDPDVWIPEFQRRLREKRKG
ncbi:conjugal transfer protein [Salmonella enterica]|nr:conjugal transfer protein [Salmonella enterica]